MITIDMLTAFLVLFVLRASNVALMTARQIFLVRGHKYLGALLGFFEVLIYVIAISAVIRDRSLTNILGYCLGFVAGSIVGSTIEERLALGYYLVRIITHTRAREIVDALRAEGFGVTELVGTGRDGLVYILEVVARRRDIPALNKTVRAINDRAFIMTEETYSVQRGYFVKNIRR